MSSSVVTLDSLLRFGGMGFSGGFGGFVVLWSPKRCLRLRHKERERAGRVTDKGGRSKSESVGSVGTS